MILKAWVKNGLFYLMGLTALLKQREDRSKPFINIVGDVFSESGLGSVTRQIIASIEGRFDYQLINLPMSRKSRQQCQAHAKLGTKLLPGITIYVGNPEILRRAFISLNVWRVIQNYNIGVWFWELERLPRPWRYLAPLIDEVWTQSNFVKTVFENNSPCVEVMPFSLGTATTSDKTRADFGIAQDAFVFLFTFDYLSHAARKNPLAVIDCFQKAFEDRADVLLLIKTVNEQFDQAMAAKLQAMAKYSQNIVFFNQSLDYPDLLRLIKLANCYVSLHRSEGLGLGLAEAMQLGTLVMATNYSGNTQFMNSANALMVNYQRVPVQAQDYPYGAGNDWAEPDTQHAIAQMQYAVAHPAQCRALVERALQTISQYNHINQSYWIAQRLAQIR
jgi:glycosyltransferase involved in cell wall biosynthesis